MSDNADAGTDNTGTQPTEVDQSTATGTADAGTQNQPETDSQSHSGTDTTTTTNQQVEGQAQAVQPTGEQKPATPWDSPENPYYKRFNDTQSHAARLYQEKTQLAKQAQEYQEKISRFEKMQQENEAKAKMLPFQKSHPEYANTRERLGKVAAFRTEPRPHAGFRCGNQPQARTATASPFGPVQESPAPLACARESG